MRPLPRVVLLFVLIGSVGAAPPPRPRKPLGIGRLVVQSTTSGADIFIDGTRAGSVPRARPFALAAGKHTLRLELRGYSPSEREIDIQAGKTLDVEADLLAFAGILLVDTPGVAAEVAVDGKLLGPTPFDGDITIGMRTIEIRAPGRKSQTRSLIIKGGQLYPLSIDLEIDAVAAPSGQVAGAGDDDGGGFDLGLPEGWYKEPCVLVGAGAAVVVAVGAAIFLSTDAPPPSGPTPEQTLTVGAGFP